MHTFIKNYWQPWFPHLPAYQTFVLRLNHLEASFQTFGAVFFQALHSQPTPHLDHLVDSFPVMLAKHGHSYRACVAHEVADVGFCATKKTRFHGVRLHLIAQRQSGRLPRPQQSWLCAASHHDWKAYLQQAPDLPQTVLFGDLAYPTPEIKEQLAAQQTRLLTPKKKPKGGDLSKEEKYYNRLVRGLRQPIESLFNWIEEKTGIQKASKVRSTDGLLIHCWGKLAVALFLLVFYY